MRFQSSEFSLFESLAGEKEVDVERAPQAADCDEEFGKVGVLCQQFGEFVDDDEQCWHGFGARAVGCFVIGVDVGEVSGFA